MSRLRSSLAVCTALLVLPVAGCSDSGHQHQPPSPEEARGSAHPALEETITTPVPAPVPVPAGAGVVAAGGGTAAAQWKPGEEFEVMGMRVKPPEGWIRQKPTSKMRQAQFKLPHADNDTYDGELTVISSGGDMAANLQRWKGQFREVPNEPLITNREVGGIEVAIVQIDGTFLYKARPMDRNAQPRPDYRVLVAVVQAPRGQVFFKSFGPRSTMEKWQEAFTDMVDSFAPTER